MSVILQESEPSIQDYARYYGLAQDHQIPGPLESVPLLEEFTFTCLTSLEHSAGGVEDPLVECQCFLEQRLVRNGPFQCTDCTNTRAKISTAGLSEERMFIDATTASVLASTIQLTDTSLRLDDENGHDARRVRRLKHTLPLLHSDHECDLREFLRPYQPDLQDEFLPFEIFDEEADKGLKWPSMCFELPNEIWKKLTTEKLEIPAEALQYFSHVVEHNDGDVSNAIFEMDEQSELTYHKKSLLVAVTPILLPMSPDHVPFLPSSDVSHLDLLSDHSSPTKEQQRKIEEQVFAKDAIKKTMRTPRSSPQSSDPMLLDSDNIGEIYSPLKGIRDPPSSPPEDRLLGRKLKIELPVVVSESLNGSQAKRKSVSFNEALTEIIPSLPGPLPDLDQATMIKCINAFVDEKIKPIALKAEQRIEQEQLQEADTTRRVNMPIMDFSLPVAPWNKSLQLFPSDGADAMTDRLLPDLKHLDSRKFAWLLNGKVERELQWTPFAAAMGKVELQEIIHDDGTPATFLAQTCCMDTNTLVWKPEGLRLLDELGYFEEEQLEEGSFPNGKDLKSLLRKRKLELQDDKKVSPASRPNRMEPSQTLRVLTCDILPHLGSLQDFIHTRICDDLGRVDPANRDLPRSLERQGQMIDKGPRQSQDLLARESLLVASLPAPLPEIMIPRKGKAFIVSATFFRDRKLVRQIQQLFPSAEFIERDSSLQLSLQPILQAVKSTQSNTSLDAIVDDADIILSPSTGLLRTTLQKIKQQALPGQTARSIVREQVIRTAPKYEKLIILISDYHHPGEYDQSHPRSVLDISDCEAVAQFTAFCSSLEDDIQAIFITGGSVELSRWIVAMMIKYSASGSGIKLIQEETIWEVFLRRAGMNAFAAQGILGKLNKKDMEESKCSDFGVTAFVKMSTGERIARFEGMLGGRKALSRTNKVFDIKW